jgi:hypothetical protein
MHAVYTTAVDLSITYAILNKPNEPVVAIAQITNVPNVSFHEANIMSPVRQAIVTPSGEATVNPLILIASSCGYKVHCDRLPAKDHIELELAIANVKAPGVLTDLADRLYWLKITYGSPSACAEWWGHAVISDLYDLRRAATSVQVDGEYTVAQRRRSILQTVNVSDMVHQARDFMSHQQPGTPVKTPG